MVYMISRNTATSCVSSGQTRHLNIETQPINNGHLYCLIAILLSMYSIADLIYLTESFAVNQLMLSSYHKTIES